MIRSQVVTLNVVYNDVGGVMHPANWPWDKLVIRNAGPPTTGVAIEVLAYGECKEHRKDDA